MRVIRRLAGIAIAASLMIAGIALRSQEPGLQNEWRSPGGDKKSTHYSPLEQINRTNVGNLRIAWRRPATSETFRQALPNQRTNAIVRTTPIFVGGVLYTQNTQGFVMALDGETGRVLWEQQPATSAPEELLATSSRGLDCWQGGAGNADTRIFVIRGEYLYAVDARTGKAARGFGVDGRTSLHFDHPLAGPFSSSLGPLVVGDVVVVPGNTDGTGDHARKKEAAPEDVRGFDAQTGRQLWTFHVVPREGEFGTDTWEDDSWKYAGDLGVWNPMSADEELGLVYFSTSAPTSAWYGGWRPGNNLFSNSLVALDARTGRRVWHFQMVHHDVWDYDNVGPAILGDITVDGRRIKAVMQANKSGFLFVLDRTNGTPVWPIEERPVPQSTVPGEHSSPTQPFPTRPPALDRQGISDADLIDYSPELKARARELVKDYVMGPLFTSSVLVPGAKKGALVLPGALGTANWNTGGFDPETGMYYGVTRMQGPTVRTVVAQGREATMAYSDVENADLTIDGLPIVKGPYGKVTALDLNKGTIAWSVANGDGPRKHPLLESLNLPPLGIPNRGGVPLVTKTLLFVGEGSNAYALGGLADWKWGRKFRALDKATGAIVAEIDLPAGTLAAPMTYMVRGRQVIVVAVGGRDVPPEYVALSLSGESKTDPIIGIWTLNLATSTFPGNSAPRSMTRTFDYTKDGLILATNDQVTADGTRRFLHWYMGVEGTEHPEYIRGTEPRPQWFLSTSVVDANTRQVHDRRADGNPPQVVDYTFAVSSDGKTMTVTQKGRNSAGQPVTTVAVFDKVF